MDLPTGKVLFIGGPRDGYRRVWPDAPDHSLRLHVASMDAYDPDKYPGDLTDHINIRTSTYTLARLAGGNGKLYTVAVESSVRDVMLQLIKGYHYHRNKK